MPTVTDIPGAQTPDEIFSPLEKIRGLSEITAVFLNVERMSVPTKVSGCVMSALTMGALGQPPKEGQSTQGFRRVSGALRRRSGLGLGSPAHYSYALF